MPKRIRIIGKGQPRIRDTSPSPPKIDPKLVAEALGAEHVGYSRQTPTSGMYPMPRYRCPNRCGRIYENIDDVMKCCKGGPRGEGPGAFEDEAEGEILDLQFAKARDELKYRLALLKNVIEEIEAVNLEIIPSVRKMRELNQRVVGKAAAVAECLFFDGKSLNARDWALYDEVAVYLEERVSEAKKK